MQSFMSKHTLLVLGVYTIVIGCVGFGFSMYLSYLKPAWLDEYHTLLLANMDWVGIFQFVAGDVHPPIYFFIAKVWHSWWGGGVESIRLLSAMAFLGAGVFFTILIQNRFKSQLLTLLAPLLFYSSPAVMYYSAEARPYSFSVLWASLVVTWLFYRTERGGELGGNWAASKAVIFGFVLSFGFYIHYTNLFLITSTLIFLFFVRGQYRYSIATAFSALFFAIPWLPIAVGQLVVKFDFDKTKLAARLDPDFISYMSDHEGGGSNVLSFVYEFLQNLASIAGVYPSGNLFLFVIFLIPFFLLGMLFLRTIAERRASSISTFLVLTLVIMCAGLYAIGWPFRRYVLVIYPVLALAVTELLWRVRIEYGPAIFMVISVLLLSAQILGVHTMFEKDYDDGTRAVASIVSDKKSNDEFVLVSAPYAQIPLTFALDEAGEAVTFLGFPLTIYEWWESQAFKGWGGSAVRNVEFQYFLGDVFKRLGDKHFVYVEYESDYFDPHGHLKNALGEYCTAFNKLTLGEVRREKYKVYRVSGPCVNVD